MHKKFKRNAIILTSLLIAIILAGFFIVKNSRSNSEPTKQEKAVAEIRKFMGDENLKVQYANPSKFAYGSNINEDIYVSEFDQFEIDSKTGKLLQFGPKPSSSKSYDESPRYTESELEAMAKDYIAKNAPEVNLANVTPNNGNKEQEHYFFRWEDRGNKTTDGYSFVQVGFSRGGSILSYINTLGLSENE